MIYDNPDGAGATIMFPLDQWGLRAFYDPAAFGDWVRGGYDSLEVSGCVDGIVCFGATRLIGDADPWASNMGHTPLSLLVDNPTLAGTATWQGRLVGLTPTDAVVGGAARLEINLGTLKGDLDFTNLESWAAGAPPGDVGSGRTWGDGDLAYEITVISNGFIQDGNGDDGAVTGMFAGRSHEYMTGVLERDDLAAGFGGRR